MLNADENKLNGSWLDAALQRFESTNDDLVLMTRSLLNRITTDPWTHARLINTLSLLEHMGSHKIMATQHSTSIDQATLRHVAEEAHHAYFMKRQAEKTAERPMEYVDRDLLAPAAARMYFQRLEASMVRVFGRQHNVRATYLYMSMIVEYRALWFYGLYQQTLKRVGLPMSLKRIIGEEQNHLVEMAQRLEDAGELSDEHASAFVACERILYERMLGAIQRAVA
jgi:hypothetical protein